MNNQSGTYCFTHSTGKDVYLFTLQNAKGTEVLISNYGAIINSFKIRTPDGEFNDIVLGFDKIETYVSEDYLLNYPWFGAAVGRYANRIKDAIFEMDGIKYQLTKNNGNNQLHGGKIGFDKKVWQLVGIGETPNDWMELSYKSVDGEEGFPGNLEVSIRFELTKDNELSYEYKAISDKDTIVNLTHHGYFNLNNGRGTIENHEMKIYSAATLEQDDNFVVTGNILPVSNTALDFNEFTLIRERMPENEGYDQSFVVVKNETSLVAEARSFQSGVHLQVYSTEPIVHFYTGKWIPVIKGKNENIYGPFTGFCLETQIHPNAINIPHFPNTILRPGEIYHSKTTYRINHV